MTPSATLATGFQFNVDDEIPEDLHGVNGQLVLNTVRDDTQNVRRGGRVLDDRRIRGIELDVRIDAVTEDRNVLIRIASEHVEIGDRARSLCRLPVRRA